MKCFHQSHNSIEILFSRTKAQKISYILNKPCWDFKYTIIDTTVFIKMCAKSPNNEPYGALFGLCSPNTNVDVNPRDPNT